MKILADENIPQVKEAFSSFGDVNLIHGRKISRDTLKDVDVLLVRSITNVNEELLRDSKVKFVGTATIGTDHIDKDYLQSKKIYFADAAGCNAFSVAEYILSCLLNLSIVINKKLSEMTLGIVGCGNVGSKVANFASALGIETIINDPPLERKFGKQNFRPFIDALKADIITLHVPLNKSGIDKTVYLINQENLSEIKSGTILLNTSRGAVVENKALKQRLKEKKDLIVGLDVWENEPNIDTELLNLVDIGTAHIAGYSLEGKLNGTFFIYKKFCDFFGTEPTWSPIYPDVNDQKIDLDTRLDTQDILLTLCNKIYNVKNDSELLKNHFKSITIPMSTYFDKLRKEYVIRREFNNYIVKLSPENQKLRNLFQELRFTVI